MKPALVGGGGGAKIGLKNQQGLQKTSLEGSQYYFWDLKWKKDTNLGAVIIRLLVLNCRQLSSAA